MSGRQASAELLFADEIDGEVEKQVFDLFDGLGLATTSRRRLVHRGPQDLEWLVLAALPLQAFLSALGSEAVKELYAGVKRVIAQRKERASDEPDRCVPLVLQDERNGLRVVLEADLPAAAYTQLTTLDLGAFRQGPLHYDRHLGAWRSELDEAGG
ncbi:hypothetical protein [Actinomycetospora chibensis]|uniref:Uncharacterized protein n=1 Tax=Actinomycetospora chibensis TaxID=663606 RepID=A0ABV9RIZ6_9PSEU|nr:hypothetical protein [Actinomycetospora chibensis]MDD7927610.1 hypothetical protein [Actinomycetospora chibensis]